MYRITASSVVLVLAVVLVLPFLSVLLMGDFLGSALTYGMQEDSVTIDALFTVREMVIG